MKTVKTLLIATIMFTFYTLFVLLLSNQSPPSQPTTGFKLCSSLYPTLLSPSSIEVIDHNTLLVHETYSLSTYLISDRNSKYLYTPESPIIDFLTLDTSLLVLTRKENGIALNLVDTSASHQVPPMENDPELSKLSQASAVIAEFPANSATLFGKSSLCITTIHNISSPEQIATEIQIYRFHSSGEITKIINLSNSLTLLPIKCEDPLFLRPPFPISPSLYRWDIPDISNNINSNKTDDLVISDTSQPEKIPETDSFNYSQLYDNEDTKLNPELQDDSIPDNSPPYFSIPGNSPPRLNKMKSEKSPSVILEGKTIVVHSQEKPTTYTIPTTSDDFTEIAILDRSTFALISSTGELWILECDEKFTFSGSNFFFKLYNLPPEDIIPIGKFTHFLTRRSTGN